MQFRPTVPVLRVAAAAPAAIAPQDAVRIALAVADGIVIPNYRSLATATQRQVDSWVYFAEDRARNNFGTLRAAYTEVADAWALAQIVTTGPISLFLRYERFAFWPETRNATQRALDALIASRDPNDLLPQGLANNNIAGQGLTALERMLYEGDDPSFALRAPGAAGERHVQVGLVLARNINLIAHQVVNEWGAADGMRAAIAANRGWNDMFADATEAARLLLTDLVGAFRLMHDQKLLPVLGESIDLARPRMAESWRSRRPARNLQLNLQAAHDMERIFARDIAPARQTLVEDEFTAAERAVNALPWDLGEAAADPARRPRVEAARDAVKATQLRIVDVLPADLGITLGFNALDGD